jgi:hypothetical protein
MANPVKQVRLNTLQYFTVCPHISIGAKEAENERFNNGDYSYSSMLLVHCHVCERMPSKDKTSQIKILVG